MPLRRRRAGRGGGRGEEEGASRRRARLRGGASRSASTRLQEASRRRRGGGRAAEEGASRRRARLRSGAPRRLRPGGRWTDAVRARLGPGLFLRPAPQRLRNWSLDFARWGALGPALQWRSWASAPRAAACSCDCVAKSVYVCMRVDGCGRSSDKARRWRVSGLM